MIRTKVSKTKGSPFKGEVLKDSEVEESKGRWWDEVERGGRRGS